MDVFDAVRTVLAVRQFAERPVPGEVVARIVEAGHLSASSMNGQPWHFVVVEDRAALRQLGGIATSGPYTASAAFAVVVAVTDSPYAVSDASRAIQSMILTAWADGVGANWVGFADLADVKPLLGLPPELDVLAIVPFGFPARPGGAGKKARKPLGEVASRGRYGVPFRGVGAD